MSPADDAYAGGTHAEDAPGAHVDDARGAHVGDAHGTGHGHELAGEPLGPIDLVAWAYTTAGGAIGVITAAALFAASAA
jgi:hypothetical protein